MLSRQEKTDILNNLIKNLESTKYWTEQELAAEMSIADPHQGNVDNLNYQISNLSIKITYLEAEKAKLA